MECSSLLAATFKLVVCLSGRIFISNINVNYSQLIYYKCHLQTALLS